MIDEFLAAAIEPKSDQLNADDLIGGPITVVVTKVYPGPSPEQPVEIAIDGDHKPYRPGKSMARVLVTLWGGASSTWVGRSMTLYRDPDVTMGSARVGGIRISHMSDLPQETLSIALTKARGKRTPYIVRRLAADPVKDLLRQIVTAQTEDELKAIAEDLAEEPDAVREACRPAYAARLKEIKHG